MLRRRSLPSVNIDKERRGSFAQRWIRNITEAVDAYKARERFKRVDQNQTNDGQDIPSDDGFEDQDKAKEPTDIQENQETSEGEDRNDQVETNEKDETSEGASASLATNASDTASSESEDNELDDDYVTISRFPIMRPPTSTSPQASSPSGQTTPTTTATSPSLQRPPSQCLQRIEVTEGPMLIEPSEVVIAQEAILQTAEPVLTPLEKLRRKDTIIQKELEEKQNLIAEVLQIPKGEFVHVADIASQPDVNKDSKELVLAVIAQANLLTEIINDSLTVTEEDAVCASAEVPSEDSATAFASTSASGLTVSASSRSISPNSNTLRRNQRIPGAPISKLIGISNSLNKYLTHLLAVISEREEEREKMRKEIRTSREQIYMLHESKRQTPPTFQPLSDNVNKSRPNSFISISSSNPSEPGDSCDLHQLEEMDELGSPAAEDDLKTPTYTEKGIAMTFDDQIGPVQETDHETFVEVSENTRLSNCPPSPAVLESDVQINVNAEEALPVDSKSNSTSDKVSDLYGAVF